VEDPFFPFFSPLFSSSSREIRIILGALRPRRLKSRRPPSPPSPPLFFLPPPFIETEWIREGDDGSVPEFSSFFSFFSSPFSMGGITEVQCGSRQLVKTLPSFPPPPSLPSHAGRFRRRYCFLLPADVFLFPLLSHENSCQKVDGTLSAKAFFLSFFGLSGFSNNRRGRGESPPLWVFSLFFLPRTKTQLNTFSSQNAMISGGQPCRQLEDRNFSLALPTAHAAAGKEKNSLPPPLLKKEREKPLSHRKRKKEIPPKNLFLSPPLRWLGENDKNEVRIFPSSSPPPRKEGLKTFYVSTPPFSSFPSL